MTVDGFDPHHDLKVEGARYEDRIRVGFHGHLGLGQKGHQLPAGLCQSLRLLRAQSAIAPEIPNNAPASRPFEIRTRKLYRERAAPRAGRLAPHRGPLVPDTVFNAFDKICPGLVPAEGAGCLCNFQVSLRPRTRRAAPDDAVPVRGADLQFWRLWRAPRT